VDEVLARGEFDAVTDLAAAFPMAVVFDLIGLPDEARPNMLRWADATFNVFGPMNARTVDSLAVVQELFGWVSTLRAEDLGEGSMGRAVFEAAEQGRIRHESCIPLIVAYAAAGMDTTINAIANAVYLFAEHPDQWDLVRADPATMSPILRGLAVMRCRARQRLVSSAKPRSPSARVARSSAL
jgi:cytochrome P450